MSRTCSRGLFTVVLSLTALAAAPGVALGEERPFEARLTGNAHLSPTDDPFVLRNDETGEGEATHLGRFTWADVEYADFDEIPDGVAVVATFTMTAANVDKSWIGTNACEIISAELGGQDVTVLNDADAAGLAEERYGAGRDQSGLVVLLTFGTGIGSAVIHNGTLIPNTELGHLEVGGKEAEQRAASSVKDKNNWSYEKWAKQVTRVLVAIENTIWPDLFIAGGGISRKADKWLPLLENRTPVVAAALENTAGIVGAAMAATSDVTH